MGTLHQQLLVLITTPLYAIIIGTEIILSNLHHTHSYRRRDTIQNFALSICSGLVDLVMRGVSFALLSFFFGVAFTNLNHSWMYWVGLLLLVDMMHYWLHRLSHTCRLFWAVHVNHHSSAQFNFTVGFRAGVMEPLYRFAFFIPVALAGFQPADILLVYSITEIWAILTHTEKVRKLGWLEYVLVTPSHHRVHHASNTRYLDRNMGSVFIFWDKLFGTFQPELPAGQYEPIRYGLKTPMQDDTLSTVIFHEWADIWQDVRQPGINWKQRLGYVFGPPGWSHNGSRHTSKELRAIEAVDNTLIQAGNG
jgi:sterol desaturase/sphingolipid hydroxylase (fatty acid hydroxylase superfamily)